MLSTKFVLIALAVAAGLTAALPSSADYLNVPEEAFVEAARKPKNYWELKEFVGAGPVDGRTAGRSPEQELVAAKQPGNGNKKKQNKSPKKSMTPEEFNKMFAGDYKRLFSKKQPDLVNDLKKTLRARKSQRGRKRTKASMQEINIDKPSRSRSPDMQYKQERSRSPPRQRKRTKGIEMTNMGKQLMKKKKKKVKKVRTNTRQRNAADIMCTDMCTSNYQKPSLGGLLGPPGPDKCISKCNERPSGHVSWSGHTDEKAPARTWKKKKDFNTMKTKCCECMYLEGSTAFGHDFKWIMVPSKFGQNNPNICNIPPEEQEFH